MGMDRERPWDYSDGDWGFDRPAHKHLCDRKVARGSPEMVGHPVKPIGTMTVCLGAMYGVAVVMILVVAAMI